MNARTLTLVTLGVGIVAGAAWMVSRGQDALDDARQSATAPVDDDDAPEPNVSRAFRPKAGAQAQVQGAIHRQVAISPAMRQRLAAAGRTGDVEPPPASVAAELAGSIARWNGIVEAAVRDASPAHAEAVRGASAARVDALRTLDARIRASELGQADTRKALHEAWGALRADVPRVVPDAAAAQTILDGLAGPGGEVPFPR